MLRKHTRRYRGKPLPAIAPARCTNCHSLSIIARCRRWACQSCTAAGRY